jgi:hypothetical protein
LRSRKAAGPPPGDTDTATGDIVSTVSSSDLSLHDLFEQQARHWLDRADLDEEQKQTILAALSCPCCGSGGMSFTVKVKDP